MRGNPAGVSRQDPGDYPYRQFGNGLNFMPQTITPRIHKTVTCAANDLVTVSYSGDSKGQVFLRNSGPGIAWVSFDSTVPAAVANANCFRLGIGETLTVPGMERNAVYTLNADTAATIVTLINL
jgi:hypothetical protein